MGVFPQAWRWWETQRLGYNAIASAEIGLAYVFWLVVLAVFEKCRFAKFEWRENDFAGQFTVLVVLLFVFNVFYCLGPLAEAIVRPHNVTVFRRVLYRVGVALSALPPFALPLSLVAECFAR